jgi:protein SCO1
MNGRWTLDARARGLAAAALLVAACAAPLWAQDVRVNPFQSVGFDQKLNEPVPLDLWFRDEEGRRVRLGEYFGRRPVLLMLVYYECPMLCTLALNGLVRSLKPLSFDVGKEFEIVTVSIDPDETPELAAAKKAVYLESYGRRGAAAGWHFLTGEPEPIRQLADSVGFRYAKDEQTGEYAHAASVVVLTPEGRTARYSFGIEHATRDLRWALIEAAAERIGSRVDHVLMLCFRYDPATGKYSIVITRILRLAAILTAAAVVLFIAVSLYRERRAQRNRT